VARKHKHEPLPWWQRTKARISGGNWGSNDARKRYLLIRFKKAYRDFSRFNTNPKQAELNRLRAKLISLGVSNEELQSITGISGSGTRGGIARGPNK